jgi:hypothetical protein
MSDAADTAAPSNREKPDRRHRRALELAMRQLITGITGLFVLLLIAIIALSVVITFKEHYETTGAFIDLLRLIAWLYSALVFVALLIVTLYIGKSETQSRTPQQ